MQLNIYVPKERRRLLEELDSTARRTGRPKNDLVLEAVERFLDELRPQWQVFHMGGVEVPSRADLYEEYLDHKLGLDAAGH